MKLLSRPRWSHLVIGSNKKFSHFHVPKSTNVWLFIICCKTKLKKKFFLIKYLFLTKYTLLAEKKCFYMEKKVLYWKFFLLKKTFFIEKKIWMKMQKIYISFKKYIFIKKMFVLQTIYKSFLNIYSFCKKKYLIIKNIFNLLKLRCEANNMVLKVSEAPNCGLP